MSVATDYFRSTERNLLLFPTGGSFDVKFRPVLGLQFSAAGAVGNTLIRAFSQSGDDVVSRGEASLGWKWKKVALWTEMDWSHGERLPSTAGGGMTFYHERSYCSLEIRRIEGEVWEGNIEGYTPIGPSLFVHCGVRAVSNNLFNEILWRLKFRFRIELDDSVIVLNIEAADFPRDWTPLPGGSGDLIMSLRYIYSFSD